MSVVELLLFTALGLCVGGIGTLIGAGGGFLLVPVLLFLYPNLSAEQITAISLTAVALNGLSGTAAYARLRRIDYRAGVWFALASLPGAALGLWLVGFVPRALFDRLMGGLLTALALYLFWRSARGAGGGVRPVDNLLRLGVLWSFLVGVVSSLTGIGGGIIHVPLLIYTLGFPPHQATATSQFVLTITAGVAAAVHWGQGNLAGNSTLALAIGLGVVVGAQLGAAASRRVGGVVIVRVLSLALVLVGVRLLLRAG